MIVWPLSCCPVPAASAAPPLTAARGPGTVPPAGVSGQRRQTASIEPKDALQIGFLAVRTNASAAGKNTLCDPPGRNTARTASMRASGKRIVPCPGSGTRNTKTHTIQPEMQSGEKSLRRSFARPLVGRFSFPRTRPSHHFSETGTPYLVPHGGRDPPALIRGLHRAAAYLKGVPRQETYKRGTPFRLISAY